MRGICDIYAWSMWHICALCWIPWTHSANTALTAEEGGGGKVIMIERGAYKDMHACLMSHPGPGPRKSAGTGPSLAIKSLTVEFHGHTCVAPFPSRGPSFPAPTITHSDGVSSQCACRRAAVGGPERARRRRPRVQRRLGPPPADQAHAPRARRRRGARLGAQQCVPSLSFHPCYHSPTVIPDYAKMRWIVRAPSYAELADLVKRVKACIE